MTTDFAIAPAEIQLVLNQFDRNRLEVSSPLHGLDVATLDADEHGYRFRSIVGPEAFEGPDVEAWGAGIEETPQYGDLLDSLLYAGIAQYVNFAEFAEHRRHLEARLPHGVLYALDTNLFYHGFPEASGISADQFVIPQIVAEELRHRLNWKYDAGKIAALKRDTSPAARPLLAEFHNQRTKQARRATHLALGQFRRIRDDAKQFPCGPGSSDKEANDALIVQAVRGFQGERSSHVMMLTADQNLEAICELDGVDVFRFALPRDHPPRTAGFVEINRWLVALAAIWGVLKVNSVLLFSDWQGRTGRQYPLKARFLNASMANGCIRDLQLCRELRGLGIDR